MVKQKIIYRWGPVIVWAGVIFGFSSLPTLPEVGFDVWDFIIKKSAHIGEYAIFFYLLRRAGLTVKQAFIVGVAYALSDEWHQSFVPGRTAKLTDVGIDTMGMGITYGYGLRKS